MFISQRFILIILLLFGSVISLLAQFEFTPANQEERIWIENALLTKKNNLHTSIWPYRRSEIDSFDRRNELIKIDTSHARGILPYLNRKLWQEHLFRFTDDEYDISVQPVIGISIGADRNAPYDYTYQNSRGIHIEGALGKTFSFYTTLVETQARFPWYVNQTVRSSRVAPGYWLTKGFRNMAHDFAYAAGEIAYTPNRTFHFRLGHGKQFVGEGYRSMLISDNAVNYPFFRIETQFWKFKYVNVWAVMNDIRPQVSVNGVFAKKYLSMHYLSINITPSVNIGFYEGLMWGDELMRYGFDINFLNPVILYRPIEFAQGFAGGNIFWGFQGSWHTPWGAMLYGQMGMDEFTLSAVRNWSEGSWLNMFSWQAGIKAGDAFGVKDLFLRLEYNIARPYTYSHREVLTNWGHYAQPLAHPWGANFNELIFMGHYRWKRWLANLAIHTGITGRDGPGENWGGDIFKSFDERSVSTGVFVGQGEKGRIWIVDASLAYVFNPLYNLRFKAGYRSRTESTINFGLPDSQQFYLGLFTNMYSSYQDF